MMCEEALTHIGMADMGGGSRSVRRKCPLLTGLEPVKAGADDAAAREGSQGDVVTLGEDGCCFITWHAMTSVPDIRVNCLTRYAVVIALWVQCCSSLRSDSG
jgi:hypothetical protein